MDPEVMTNVWTRNVLRKRKSATAMATIPWGISAHYSSGPFMCHAISRGTPNSSRMRRNKLRIASNRSAGTPRNRDAPVR